LHANDGSYLPSFARNLSENLRLSERYQEPVPEIKVAGLFVFSLIYFVKIDSFFGL